MPGRAAQALNCCLQVSQLLKCSGAVDTSRLASPATKTAWVARLDLYVLDLDGCLLDACLLAAVASLAQLRSLPELALGEDGEVSCSLERMILSSWVVQLTCQI